MKVFYISGSILFSVLILIVGFGNIAAVCTQVSFLFSTVQTSVTMMVFGVAIFGIIAGMFYHALFIRIMSEASDEEYDDDDSDF